VPKFPLDIMADSNLPAGVSIPGSGQRKLKTYSVSLHENTFDISEVPAATDALSDEEGKQAQSKQKCQTCGQALIPKKYESFSFHGSSRKHNDRNPKSQISSSLPTENQGNLDPSRTGYQSIDSNGAHHQENGLDHCHGIQFSQPDSKAKKKLILASILCLIFMVGEVIGGYLANSLAIATDAAHLLTDFASFMISLFSLWVAARPPTKRMSFGWYRAEVIGALTSVLMIWVVTGILVYLSVLRLINKEFDIDAKIMLITSGIGVLFNIVMGLTLHQHGHSHGGGGSHNHGPSHSGSSHGHSHADPESQPLISSNNHSHHTQQENINVRAAFIHVVGDFVQSIGVFIAAVIIYFKPTWNIVDPICTFMFSILVLITTVAILRDALTVLMEGLPRGLDFNRVQQAFLSIDGVSLVHNLRIWALSMDKIALAAHIVVHKDVKNKDVLLEASSLIRSRFNIFEMTLQIEEFQAGMEDCSQCQDPAD